MSTKKIVDFARHNNKVKNCMIDWLELSLFEAWKDTVEYSDSLAPFDALKVIQMLDLSDLSFTITRARFYDRVLVYDNCIYIQDGFKGNTGKVDIYNADKEKLSRAARHVHIKITGRGCRFLEQRYNLGLNNPCGLVDLRQELNARFMFLRQKVSRMDIAIDLHEKFVREFLPHVFNKEVKGVMRCPIAGDSDSGFTFYLGSKKSDKFIRCYEKDCESGDFTNYKDRIELQLRDTYATFEYSNENNIYHIVSSYMSDIEFTDSEINQKWLSYMGSTCEISPKIRHKKTTIDEKMDYVLKTYKNLFFSFLEIHGESAPLKVTDELMSAALSEKYIQIIKNAKALKRYKQSIKAVKAANKISKFVASVKKMGGFKDTVLGSKEYTLPDGKKLVVENISIDRLWKKSVYGYNDKKIAKIASTWISNSKVNRSDKYYQYSLFENIN